MLHNIAYDFWLEIHRECENRHVHTFLSNINGNHIHCHFIKVNISVMTERTFVDVLHNFMIRVFSYWNLTL